MIFLMVLFCDFFGHATDAIWILKPLIFRTKLFFEKMGFETIDFPNTIIFWKNRFWNHWFFEHFFFENRFWTHWFSEQNHFLKNRFWNHWFSEQNYFKLILLGKSMVSKLIFSKNNFVRKTNGFKTGYFRPYGHR